MTASSNSRIFLLLFLATLAAFGPFVTDFYLPTLPEQTTDFHTSPAMVQLGLSNIMWGLAAQRDKTSPKDEREPDRRVGIQPANPRPVHFLVAEFNLQMQQNSD